MIVKKILFLLSLLTLLTFVAANCEDNNSVTRNKNNDNKDENPLRDLSVCGNFSLEIEVSKETANVGDTITVTATLLNLSGKAVEIEFIQRGVRTSATGENMIHLSVAWGGILPAIDTIVESVKTNIAQNGVLTRTIEEKLNLDGEYHVWAEAIFFTDKNSNKPITLRIDSIRIQVK